MKAPLHVPLVLRTLLSVFLLLLLSAVICASAALASEPACFDPFFYGGPTQLPSPGLAASATDAPIASVHGHVFPYGDFYPAAHFVSVETYDGSGSYLGYQSTTTDQSGFYSLADVPAGTGHLFVRYEGNNVVLERSGLQIAEGSNELTVYPGAVQWTNTKGGPFNGSSSLNVVLGGIALSPDGPIRSSRWFSGAVVSGEAWSLPGQVEWAQCYYRENEVATWALVDTTETLHVIGGEPSSGQIDFHQDSAARMRIVWPRWQSGKPGTVMKMRFENWPMWTGLALTGLDASVPATTWNDLTYDVSTSLSTRTLNLKVPTTAKVGRFFTTDARGTVTELEIPTNVSAYFQVSTVKPSRARIAKGQAVRLSGRVPVLLGPDGTAGTRKYVTIWARRQTAADAPAKWDPRAAGWRKVATVRTDAFGRYVTPKLRPSRSTSYVCRYPGDPTHFRAYTSVCRVRVR